ncbi:hypothetical protein BDM02DRAFT_3109338 [Thelephora ganbajun]|uniref:Uncharacterized protein n=1 Tax=Thelephora ganbajun TaxID=370292 RepID=A0ACB6ZRV2_THEGA|nr:hypothetical protein BDM02DRAFT_3109338 [Thelephora ganbajun]
MVKPADRLQPSKSRNEKQIIAFNLDRKEIEKSAHFRYNAFSRLADILCSPVPVLHDVRDIVMSQNNQFVLASHENKVGTAHINARYLIVLVDVLITCLEMFHHLWKIEMIEKQTDSTDSPSETAARPRPRHTHMSKATVDSAGPSYFGGKGNQLIMCWKMLTSTSPVEMAYR